MKKIKITAEELSPTEILSEKDLFPNFCCGENGVDEFIQKQAHNHQKKRLGVTYIFKHFNKLIGFGTIAMGDINKEKLDTSDRLPKSIPNYPILLIGQLGVCKDQQHGGIGSHICDYFIDLALKLSDKIGCRFVFVNAIPKKEVIKFYQDKGFIMLPKQESRKQKAMILTLPDKASLP